MMYVRGSAHLYYNEKNEKLLLWHLKKKNTVFPVAAHETREMVTDTLCIWVSVLLSGQAESSAISKRKGEVDR